MMPPLVAHIGIAILTFKLWLLETRGLIPGQTELLMASTARAYKRCSACEVQSRSMTCARFWKDTSNVINDNFVIRSCYMRITH